MKSIRIGGLPKSTELLDRLQLPVLQDVEAIVWAMDALVHAASERKGVILVAEKGAGKTMALKIVVSDFDSTERLKEENDAAYPRRRTVLIHGPRSKSRSEILGVIWKAALGVDMNFKVRGRRKPDDLLLDTLVEHLLNQNVAVLVFDEAENLSDEAFELIRDIISVAESKSKERFAADTYAPAGVGVLIGGTLQVKNRIMRTEEAAHRWVRVHEIAPLTTEQSADVYRRFLPAFDARAREIGEKEWAEFIRLKVARGRSLPIRAIENHVRTYVRRVVIDDMGNDEMTINFVEDIPYSEEIFFQSLEELAMKQKSNGG